MSDPSLRCLVLQSEPLSRARAIYEYTAANGEELTIGEDDLLLVYEKDDEWLLVKIDGQDKLGYVPANYVQEEEGSAGEAGFTQAEVSPRGHPRRSQHPYRDRLFAHSARWSLSSTCVGNLFSGYLLLR